MERNGLFFDPLQGEDSLPEGGLLLEEEALPAGRALRDGESAEETAADDVDASTRARHRRPDPEDLQAQRRRELDRVQEDLRRMAQGFPVAVAPSRRRRTGGTGR